MTQPAAGGTIVLGKGVAPVPGAPPLVYRDVALLERPGGRRFSLVVEEGAVIAVVGEEHSGVGWIGRLALGLVPPPSGSVEAFGVPIARLPYSELLVFRRRLGYLPLGDGLLQNLSLKDNVALPLRFATDHRLREVEDRVAQLIEDFRLRAIAALRPAQATEEDRRRAAMARAVALRPKIVVLERPFDGLSNRAATALLDKASRDEDGTRRAVLLTTRELAPSLRAMVTGVVRVAEGGVVEDPK